MTIKEQMDAIYRDLSLDDIPWNMESPPDVLVRLVESGWVAPCEALDLGCGAGNHAVWLASRGFRVTGFDISRYAVEAARHLAETRGVVCHFHEMDMTSVVNGSDGAFDFAYDWEMLHHVLPEHRPAYVTNVHRMLRPDGKYLSLCFSDDEPPSFGGSGKLRKTPLGTTLYFSSEEELRNLFAPLFHIQELSTIEVPGKKKPHVAIKALMSKKGVPAATAVVWR